jgi:hypothetical protein
VLRLGDQKLVGCGGPCQLPSFVTLVPALLTDGTPAS